jgi:flagellar basal-body rod protein FlgB
MSFLNMPLFDLMKSHMAYAAQQQTALSQNIANADTPGYKAMDIKEPDFKKLAQSAGLGGKLPMTVTNPQHMTSMGAGGMTFKMEKRANTDELNPDGNNVVIEEEMSKVAANQADYQKVLNLYGKSISLFKIAIGNTGGG